MKVVKNHYVMIAVVQKICKECNIMKKDFYSYKNGKMYCTCIQDFNKTVMCDFCNKELNKSYLRSHVKKQHIKNQYYNQDDKISNDNKLNDNKLNDEIIIPEVAKLRVKLRAKLDMSCFPPN